MEDFSNNQLAFRIYESICFYTFIYWQRLWNFNHMSNDRDLRKLLSSFSTPIMYDFFLRIFHSQVYNSLQFQVKYQPCSGNIWLLQSFYFSDRTEDCKRRFSTYPQHFTALLDFPLFLFREGIGVEVGTIEDFVSITVDTCCREVLVAGVT